MVACVPAIQVSPPTGEVKVIEGVSDVVGITVVMVAVVVAGGMVVVVVIAVVVGAVVGVVVVDAGGCLTNTVPLLMDAGMGCPLTSPNITFDRFIGDDPICDFATKVILANTPSAKAFFPGVMITPLTAFIKPFAAMPGWKKVFAPSWESNVPSSTFINSRSEGS
jgi:hypothetical protein